MTMSMGQVLYHGSGKCLLLSLITACAGFLLVRCCEHLVRITFDKSYTAIGHTSIYNSEHFFQIRVVEFGGISYCFGSNL